MSTVDRTGASDAEFEASHALAEAIRRRWVLRGDANPDEMASSLLPTVQRLIADAEKRAAARAAAYAYEQGYDACRHGEQRRNPYRAAAVAALDPS